MRLQYDKLTLQYVMWRQDSTIPAWPAHLLLLAHIHNTRQDLLVPQLGESHNGTSALDRLNDLGGLIACQGKASGVAVDLHGSSQCLLSPTSHAAGRHTHTHHEAVNMRSTW